MADVPASWLNFASDNVWGAAPAITAAMADMDMSPVASYGEDPITESVTYTLKQVFEAPDMAVFPVATGTAANALALATVCPPYGVVYATDVAHIVQDECGAPEFYGHGTRLYPFPAQNGKLDPRGLDQYLATVGGQGVVHHMQPAAVSITQATECGTLYSVEEIRALADVAHRYGLPLHMDGARFANALVTLGVSAAEMTWQAGVDVLSFGATKNGAWAAEVVLVFQPDLVRDFDFRRKRGGHLLSKMRFVTAQLAAYLSDDLWLENAAHANAMAQKLAQALQALDLRIVYPVEANEIFVQLPPSLAEALRARGFVFYDWPFAAENVVRLVTAYATPEAAVDALIAACRNICMSGESKA